MMKQNSDLEKLFRAAKVMRPVVKEVEEGFESRLAARFQEEKQIESFLSVWTWRLAPVMAVPLVILIMISAFLNFQERRNLSSPFEAYERAQMMYMGGE